METPSQKLAEKLLERLVAEGLLSPQDQKKLLTKLVDGKLKQEDWRLAIELAAGRKGDAT